MLEDKQEIWRDLHRLSCDSHGKWLKPFLCYVGVEGGGGPRAASDGEREVQAAVGGPCTACASPARLLLAANVLRGQREEVVGWGRRAEHRAWPAPGSLSPRCPCPPAGTGCARARCLTFTYSLPDSRPLWWLEGKEKNKFVRVKGSKSWWSGKDGGGTAGGLCSVRWVWGGSKGPRARSRRRAEPP